MRADAGSVGDARTVLRILSHLARRARLGRLGGVVRRRPGTRAGARAEVRRLDDRGGADGLGDGARNRGPVARRGPAGSGSAGSAQAARAGPQPGRAARGGARQEVRCAGRRGARALARNAHPDVAASGAAPGERRGSIPRPCALEGSKVVLVDDVLTTGATLGSAAQALGAAGAAEVGAVSFARAPKP
ncbi:MAG: phosphoribosyltransferase family protein [Gemmatimonadales bacterium]